MSYNAFKSEIPSNWSIIHQRPEQDHLEDHLSEPNISFDWQSYEYLSFFAWLEGFHNDKIRCGCLLSQGILMPKINSIGLQLAKL